MQQRENVGQYPEVNISFDNIKGNILSESNFYYTVYILKNYNIITLYFNFDKRNMQVKGSEILEHHIKQIKIKYINKFNIINTLNGAVCFTEQNNL